MLVLHARLKLAQGMLPRFQELLAAVAPPSRAEDGCSSYRAYRSLEDPNEVVFVEEWKSQAALDLHFQTPHFRAYDRAVAALLAEPPRIRTYEAASYRDL
ncbi:MAG TPA: putative quinol monooxygenase [Anaeromyxobacteraceae bacterium]|jgi:quinol monooxygenase YgiN|nr:putative quinol monooxygenase [Anaeromyxobacteraceae bacterium]